jgi:hypothetical protein
MIDLFFVVVSTSVYGFGCDLLEEGRCLCFLQSIDETFLPSLSPLLSLKEHSSELTQNNTNLHNNNLPDSNQRKDRKDSRIESTSTTANNKESQQQQQQSHPVQLTLPELPPRTVRARIPFGGFLLSPLSAETTHASFIYTVDPVMPYLPRALLNWGLEVGAANVFKQLTQCAQRLHDPDSPYFTRLQEKKSFYDSVLGRFYEVVQENQREEKNNILSTTTTTSSSTSSPSKDKDTQQNLS